MTRRATFALWLAVALIAGVLSALVPPVQSPDEHSHIMRASLIARGEFTLKNDPALGTGGLVDTALLSYLDAYLSTIARSAQTPLPPRRREQAEALRWGAGERFVPLAGTNYYLPLAYAPHAAALLAGRALDLSVADSYRLVRAACLATCLLLLFVAWRVMPLPPLAIALLLLPMTMFQIVSPTLDGVTTCLAVLALSLFVAGAAAGERWSPGRSWLLVGCVALLATTRIQLLPLLAAPFYVAWVRRTRRDALLGAAAVLLAMAWLAYALATTVDVRVQRTPGTTELLWHYAAAPREFLRVVGASIADPQLSAFYAHSFIGVLGWLDTLLPQPAYPVLWVGLGACAVVSLASADLRAAWPARLLLAGGGAACVLLVFLALLLTWTPHPARTVEGVQGRYFIVPALMLAYALGAPTRSNRLRTVRSVVLVAFAVLALWALVTTLLARYH